VPIASSASASCASASAPEKKSEDKNGESGCAGEDSSASCACEAFKKMNNKERKYKYFILRECKVNKEGYFIVPIEMAEPC